MSTKNKHLTVTVVILSKLLGGEKWQIVTAPIWDICTRYQSDVLLNESNDYVECSNCGVVYRMVRLKDLGRYLDDTNISQSCVLDTRHRQLLKP